LKNEKKITGGAGAEKNPTSVDNEKRRREITSLVRRIQDMEVDPNSNIRCARGDYRNKGEFLPACRQLVIKSRLREERNLSKNSPRREPTSQDSSKP